MLEIRGLRKVFSKGTPNEHTALRDVDLTLQDGEFVTVLGSNGAGKSTLFNAICGVFWPDAGSIVLNGRNITYLPEHRRARVVGRVFQDPMLGTAPHMTIEENLALAYARTHRGPLALAVNKKESELFRERLAGCGMGLEDRMKTKVGLLSGGQRQVVALLMCTLCTPELLLLDEHTAALDPAAAENVMKITRSMVAEKNITTMMITHNISSALATGSRTIMMDGGEIIFDVSGAEREKMTMDDLLSMYAGRQARRFDNDRMLFDAYRREQERACGDETKNSESGK